MRSLPFRADFSGIARSTPLRIQHMSKNPRHERSPKLKRRRVLREPPLCSTALRSGARWGVSSSTDRVPGGNRAGLASGIRIGHNPAIDGGRICGES
jgi:hypothetical protein